MRGLLRKLLPLQASAIRLDRIDVKNGNTVVYKYSVSDDIRGYFQTKNEFFLKYDLDISDVPESILAIPFAANVLPIAWVADATLYLPDIDRDFYYNIEKIKEGYRTVHPKIKFGGRVKARKVTDNAYEPAGGVAQSFSGGVDSFNTLVNHIEEKPTLITLIGSDIFFEDAEGIQTITKDTREAAEQFGLKYHMLESNFRGFLDEAKLSELTTPVINDGWWHSMQHGIGLIGHIAPIAYLEKLKTFYFPSTFTQDEFERGLSCASYPVIDEGFRVATMRTIHDGFEFARQQKIQNICRFADESGAALKLRVCWQSKGGKNCCDCEKCFRTLVAIISERHDPNNFNFVYTKQLAAKIKGRTDVAKEDVIIAGFWRVIVERLNANRDYLDECYPELKWLLKEKF